MKRAITLIFLFFGLFSFPVLGQDFSDDFESYDVGDYLAQNSSEWTTWSGSTGGNEDVRITDERAFSGSQSIYFESNTSGGGPQDVVLPFDGLKTDGLFDFSMMVYIPDNGSGYFNFQGAQEVGETWAMDCYITGDGVLEVGTGGTLQASAEYAKEDWFEVRIRADLGNNLWSLYLDGNCVGAFTNPTNMVSHLDLFPLGGDAFYVDDVSYTYDVNSPQIDNDYAIEGLRWPKGGLAGTSAKVNVGIKNNIGANIESAVVVLNANGEQYMDEITGLDVGEGEAYWFEFSQEFTLQAGTQNFEAQLQSVNGEDTDDFSCNDKGSLVFNSVDPAQHKSVLVEEGTGTWCQWCPRGAVFMDLLTDRYPDHFVPVAVHNNDPMVVTAYDFSIRAFPGFTGFPSVIVNRSMVTDPSTMEAPFLERVAESTAARLTNGAHWDPDTRELSISVTADFMEDIDGDYRLLAVVTEDSVTGTSSGYAQVNAYAGGNNGPMGGYENLPNPVPASMMVYEHVARALLGGFVGKDESLPNQVSAGSQETAYFSWTVPDDYDVEHMNIVSVMVRPDRSAENSEIVTLDQALQNGVTATNRPVIDAAVDLAPNPAVNETHLTLEFEETQEVRMELVQANGTIIRSRDYGSLKGKYVFPLRLDALSPGMYFLRITTEEGQAVKKLIVTPR